MTFRETIVEYIRKKYKAEPEFLWKRFPNYAAFRHEDNRKWFALIMDVTRKNLGLGSEGKVDVINVKLDDPFLIDLLIGKPGYYRGYHVSRGHWLTVLLDGTVPAEDVCGLIDESFRVTASKQKQQKMRPPKEWIIPANPKYYDVVGAFERAEIIDWKQGAGIRKGDTVYMYVAAPVSAVLFKCAVLETDIPYNHKNEHITIKALMKIKLLRRYEPERFTFDILKEEYGIYAVRGPRGIPHSLSEAFKE